MSSMLTRESFAAVGVTDFRFAWGDGQCTFPDDFPLDQRALVEEVVASYDPNAGPTLEEAQAARKGEVTSLRDQLRTRGVQFGGSLLATQPEDQGTYGDSITYLSWKPEGATLKWKATSGWIEVDLPTLRAAAEAVGDFIEALFETEHAHHAAIDALGSVEAVQAYDITAGWPE